MALAYVLPGLGRRTRIRWLVTACAGGSRSGVAGSPRARPIGPRRDVRIGGRRCLQPLALASLAGCEPSAMAAALPVADHLDAHEQVRRKRAAEVVQR
jgi:hypothetical protein